MLRKLLKSSGELLQFLIIFGSLSSCFTLVSSVGAKSLILCGNQLEKHEETIDYVASTSGGVFLGFVLFNIVGLTVETTKNWQDDKKRELEHQKQQALAKIEQQIIAENKRIQDEINSQCMKCDFYCVNAYLRCAVHPYLKHNCGDFQPQQDRPPVKLVFVNDSPPEPKPELPKKPFYLSDFTHANLLYCVLVSSLEDWNDTYFCERALIEKYDEVYRCSEDESESSPWLAAYNLSIEEVTDLQERLRSLDSDEWYFFNQAIKTFVAIG